MMVIKTTGYLVSVLGPYLADSKNNDASILNHIIQRNVEEIKNWLKEEDILFMDRGFRDTSDVLVDLGIRIETPCFFLREVVNSTEESNRSGLVTKV